MKTLLLSVVSVIILATSCIGQKPKTEVAKDDRNLSGFNIINTYSSIDLIIKQGDKESVVVETNEEFQKQVITTVEGNKLTIKVKGNIYNPTRFNVYITVKDLKDVRSSGSGDIESVGTLEFPSLNFKLNGSGDLDANLKSNTVSVEVNGSGDVEIEGEINELNVHLFGSGDFDIEEIDFKKVLVSMSGSGDIELSGSSDLFNLDLSGSGDLKGEDFKVKEVNANCSGSGDVKIAVEETANAKISGSGDFKIIGNPSVKNLKATGSGDFN